MVEEYLLSRQKANILEILHDVEHRKHYAINISFVELFENDTNLGNKLLKQPEEALKELDKWILIVQENISKTLHGNFCLKENVHARVHGLPICPDLHRNIFPKNEDLDLFLQLTGNVVRVTATKMLEYQRPYICSKCKYIETVKAIYDQKYIIFPPKKCTNPEKCSGTNLINSIDLDVGNCKDYQEIKIQEQPSKLGVGSMPNSMWVTLEDDLVDTCKPGDDVTICGVIKRRWGPFIPGKRIEVELVVKANHVHVNNEQASSSLITPDVKNDFANFWKQHELCPLEGRNLILKSFCPKLYGMYLVKLAMAVVLAGGSKCTSGSEIGIQIRSEPHILLVGDPGTGKSQLLRYAAKIIPRSVLTTGVGTTSAGLTCAAVMEDGQWQLEGGALVLADGGICCIDEFNSMKAHDRTSIHEAMEQQTISVAKASMVCKLRTRCSLIAATNPKGGYLDPAQTLSLNLNIPSPLLSRFDVVLMLKDNYDKDWDNLIADYILSGTGADVVKMDKDLWNLETLQKYFSVIRNLNPVLTSQANKILSSYYQVQRRAESRNKARTTVRLLDSLVRLSQAHARLMFHLEVQIMDAVFAILLIESSMHGECSVLLLETINLQAPFTESPMANYKELLIKILSKLELHETLEEEIVYFNQNFEGVSKICNATSKNTNTECETENGTSRFFHKLKIDPEIHVNKSDLTEVQNPEKSTIISNTTDDNKIVEIKTTENTRYRLKDIESTGNTPEVNKELKRKRKDLKSFKYSKESKILKTAKPKLNDLQMINLIRSVNDEFDTNILDFESDKNNTCADKSDNTILKYEDKNIIKLLDEVPTNNTNLTSKDAEMNEKKNLPKNSNNTSDVFPVTNEDVSKNLLQKKVSRLNLKEKFSFKPRQEPNTNLPVTETTEAQVKNKGDSRIADENTRVSENSEDVFMTKDKYENLSSISEALIQNKIQTRKVEKNPQVSPNPPGVFMSKDEDYEALSPKWKSDTTTETLINNTIENRTAEKNVQVTQNSQHIFMSKDDYESLNFDL